MPYVSSYNTMSQYVCVGDENVVPEKNGMVGEKIEENSFSAILHHDDGRMIN